MPTVGIHVKGDSKLVRKGLEDLGAAIPKVGAYQIYRTLQKAKVRLKKPGKKVVYPINWDNPRQKIKVIIMLKKDNNLPYRRQGDYQQGFKIIKAPNGYDLVNDLEKASFIGGDAEGQGQSKIFRGRYPIVRQVIDEEFAKLPSAVVEHLIRTAKDKGLNAASR